MTLNRHGTATDEWYTPPKTKKAIEQYFRKKYNLHGKIAHPFYPGGDYKNFNYAGYQAVIDNPPFSQNAEIADWYNAHGIKYVLYFPSQVSVRFYKKGVDVTVIKTRIKYLNDDSICTAFYSNVRKGHLYLDGVLTDIINKIQGRTKPYSPYDYKSSAVYQHHRDGTLPPRTILSATTEQFVIPGKIQTYTPTAIHAGFGGSYIFSPTDWERLMRNNQTWQKNNPRPWPRPGSKIAVDITPYTSASRDVPSVRLAFCPTIRRVPTLYRPLPWLLPWLWPFGWCNR